MPASSASMPPRRTATDSTTGTPSSRDRRSTSIAMPRLRAMSIMLSDSITGRPTRFSSSASRSASRRLEASATQTIRSGATSLCEAAQHDVARDLLVGRARAQGIGAGQVDHLDRPAGRRGERADLLLDRDAGIVGDLLAAAGQGVEQRGLAAVGIADERDDSGGDDGGAHEDAAVTRIAMASRRRSAMVVCGDAHGDGIAAEQALVQQLDVGAFDEAQLDQPAFQFRAGQAGAGAVHGRADGCGRESPRGPRPVLWLDWLSLRVIRNSIQSSASPASKGDAWQRSFLHTVRGRPPGRGRRCGRCSPRPAISSSRRPTRAWASGPISPTTKSTSPRTSTTWPRCSIART